MLLKPITVGFVDDLPDHFINIRKALQNIKNVTITIEAVNGNDLISKINATRKKPDIILMDLQMPSCDGLTATTCIKYLFPEIKIVGLSVHTSSFVIAQLLVEGGDGFLSKFIVEPQSMAFKGYENNNPLELALQKIMDGEKHIDEMLDDVKNLVVNGTSCFERITDLYPSFSRVDIGYIFLNAAGMSRLNISKILGVGESTLKKNIAAILKKFNIKNHQELNKYTSMHGMTKFVQLFQTIQFDNINNSLLILDN